MAAQQGNSSEVSSYAEAATEESEKCLAMLVNNERLRTTQMALRRVLGGGEAK